MVIMFLVYVKNAVISRDKNHCSYSFFQIFRDFAYFYEPCIIPEYLRGREEFEAIYDISSSNSYQRLLDDNPDQTCESLYEYVYISVLSSSKNFTV